MLYDSVLCLLSGGIDSAVLLWKLKREFKKVSTLFILYNGQPIKERASANIIAKKAGVLRHMEVKLSGIITKLSRNGYIPNRNMMYYSIAGNIAEGFGINHVAGAHIKSDSSDFIDAKLSYFKKVEKVMNNDIKFYLPFIEFNKKDIIVLGMKLGVPFDLTWSCYYNRSTHCEQCSSCLERSILKTPKLVTSLTR